MKKIYLAMLMAAVAGTTANAQESEGGLPWSVQNSEISALDVEYKTLSTPDYAKYQAEDLEDATSGAAKPYRVEARVYTDISLQNSGTWYYMPDGRKVWRLLVEIPMAKALDFYYDAFRLPDGVKFYLSNGNGRQLLGAYTKANENEFGTFTNEQIQGNLAQLEMDIPGNIAVEDIKFHIHRIGAGYRGFEYLDQRFATGSVLAERPTASSPCHVNANCPDGDTEAWQKAKSATVRINIDDAGWCSGTLLNNTGNSSGSCKPYVLTASHCDGANGRDDEHFANWKFDFNFQTTTCEGPGIGLMQTRTGAYFRARANSPSFTTPDNSYVADFLLLEMRQTPLASSNAYLAGWNRNYNLNDEDIDYRFIGFHHPAGDSKKLSRSNYVNPLGTFNQTAVSGTHWQTSFTVGGMEPGSSGSGFFDQDGLLVGDLSGGPEGTGSCAPMGISALYSKISYAWENEYDQTAFPTYAGAQSRLKDWLDPTGSGAITCPTTTADCATGISIVDEELKKNSMVYPVPSKDGQITVKWNLSSPAKLSIRVFDITGKQTHIFQEVGSQSQAHILDLSTLSNGIYFLQLEADSAKATHKIVISK